MKKNRHVIQGIRIAMAYIGTVIGAGFASGQEILQFFSHYGYKAVWAIILSTVLFVIVGRMILDLGAKLQVKSFRRLMDQLFGVLSPVLNLYLAVAFLLLCAAMFAGSGALFSEVFGLPFMVGALLTAIPAFVVTLYGIKGIITINSIVVPLMILFHLLIFIFVCQLPFKPAVDWHVYGREILPLAKSGISYASFNLILTVGVLAPMGSTIRDPKALYIGSLIGGVVLGLLLVTGNYALLHFIPEVFHREIPFMFIVQKMGRNASYLFSIVIWCGIFTTLIGNLFSGTSMIQELFHGKPVIITCIFTFIGLLLCSLGFSNIVSWFYPILGMIGFVLVGMIIIHTKTGGKYW